MDTEKRCLKFVFIGAGSSVFTLNLVGDLILEKSISKAVIALVDIDIAVLNDVTLAVKKMIEKTERDFIVEQYESYKDALDNADFVFFTFAIGGINSWKRDIEICSKHDINQSVGDTIGPGGIIRTLRTVPVVLDIAEQMSKKCPNAWVINYVNPEGAVCVALLKYTKIKAFGLCHGTPNCAKDLAEHVYGVDVSRLRYRAAGVNHLTWFTDLQIDNSDVYTQLMEMIINKGWDKKEPISTFLYDTYGLYPAPSDRHVKEFFPFFLKEGVLKERNYRWKNNDFVVIDKWRDEAHERFDKVLNSNSGYEHFLQDSGETACNFIRSLITGEICEEMVNVVNDGYIDNISKDVIVEIPTFVDRFGLHPQKIGKLPDGIAAKCDTLGREYLLAVEAAVRGDYKLALQAMMLDPLVSNCDYPHKLLDELLEINIDLLPTFK